MEADMRRSIALTAILVCALVSSASAQNNVPNNMGVPPYQQVAPLAPPPQPTPSPLPPGSYISPDLQPQPRADSYGDKVTRCLHYGAGRRLTCGDLSAYSPACAKN